MFPAGRLGEDQYGLLARGKQKVRQAHTRPRDQPSLHELTAIESILHKFRISNSHLYFIATKSFHQVIACANRDRHHGESRILTR